MPLHRNSDYLNNHTLQSLSYADATARNAAVLAASDIGRIAIQLDDNSFYILRNHAPLTWTSIVAAGAAPGGVPTQVQNVSAAAGVSTNFAREDHVHNVETATAVGLSPGGSSSAGSGTALALANHTHSLAAFGASAGTFCQGNDARLSDARTPTGAAGGQLGGSYPNPDVRGLRETAGPQNLTMGAVADGQYLARSGTNVVGVTPPVFGTQYHHADSPGDSTTTSNTFQTKLTLTTGSLPAGTYIILWSYAWAYNSTTTDFIGQVLEDDTTTVMYHAQEPQDAGTTAERQAIGGHIVRTLSAGVHNYKIQYRSETGGVTSLITGAHLTLWRVA